jgi:hypothetical protein
MKRSLRYLRITFSATCLIACVLLIVLWVRSYKTADRLHGHTSDGQAFLIASKEGRIANVLFRWDAAPNWFRWKLISYPIGDELSFPVGTVQGYKNKFGFGWLNHPIYYVMRSTQQLPDGSTVDVWGAATTMLDGAGPIIPDWFLVLVLGTGAAAPWIPWLRWRFSLRTLLIATTLVAVVLGTIVWSMRAG